MLELIFKGLVVGLVLCAVVLVLAWPIIHRAYETARLRRRVARVICEGKLRALVGALRGAAYRVGSGQPEIRELMLRKRSLAARLARYGWTWRDFDHSEAALNALIYSTDGMPVRARQLDHNGFPLLGRDARLAGRC